MKLIKSFLSSKVALMFLALFTSMTAAAGLHAYTNNLRVANLMLDLIYYSEIGSSYAGIFLG